MNFSSLSLRRPVLTLVFSAFLLLLGGIGLSQLGVREYPAIDPPLINVQASYPGANAEVITHQITEPLEQSLNGIEGVRSLSSTSRDGAASISVEFFLGTDLEKAASDVRDRVSRARGLLPSDIDPPVVAKADANSSPILLLTVQSDSRSLEALSEKAAEIRDQLQTTDGVAQIDIWGEHKYAMRLDFDPQKMAALGITFPDLRKFLAAENAKLPVGFLEGSVSSLSLEMRTGLASVEDFERVVLRSTGGKVVRLSDVATVRLGAENERNILRCGGRPMVGLSILPQPGADQIRIAREIQARLDRVRTTLPPDIAIGTTFDNTKFVRKALLEVRETILIAFALVALVIFVFLGSWRTAVIPLLAVPISLIGVFFPLWILGFSINVLTLLGVVLAIGLVVDDAIVVLENIYVRIERGATPRQAAVDGVGEIFSAVVSTTLVLAAVFTPLFFLSGFTGRLFREFGAVIAGSALFSGFVALTLGALLSGRLLRREEPGRFKKMTDSVFARLQGRYGRVLSVFIARPWLSFGILAAALSLTVLGFRNVPKELAPMEDRSNLSVRVTGPEGATFAFMDDYMKRLQQAVDKAVPEISTMIVMTGAYGGTVNTGMCRVMLVPPEERKRSQQQIARALQGVVAKLEGANAFVMQDPSIKTDRRSSLGIQFVLQAPDLESMKRTLPRFVGRVRGDSGFATVDVDLKFTKPQLDLEVERERLRDLGLTPRDIVRNLQLALSESRWGYFERNGKQYSILARLDSVHRASPTAVGTIPLRTVRGELLPLGTLLTLREKSVPPQLFRMDRWVSATVSAEPAAGQTLGDGLGRLKAIAKDSLPESFRTALTGSARDFTESSDSVLRIFLLSLAIVYLILAAQFESFREPFVILLTVPLALAGAMGSLWAFGQTLNLFSQIGLVMLVGLVTKNGILIVEFANQRQEAGRTPRQAVFEAAQARLRPILMTTFCMVLGTLPIALALGAGAESRKPMGTAIIGGLLVSLCLTLLVIPAMYVLVARTTHPEGKP